jgi:YidC/Oxa1 family membrane protein insertase
MLLENRGTDRNQIIGFVLIGAILIGASFWTQSLDPKPEPAAQEETAASAAKPVQSPIEAVAAVSTDTAFAAREAVLENKNLRLTWTTAGAQMVRAELKEYKNWQKKPLLSDSSFVQMKRLMPTTHMML